MGNSNQFYREFGYLIVKDFVLSAEARGLAKRMRAAQADELVQKGRYFRDNQVALAYSNSSAYDDLLEQYLPNCSRLMEIPKLRAVSSYARIYEHGAELRAHQDRPELQHSATVCLSRDSAEWVLCLYDLKGNLVKVTQSVGDALLYRGKLLHWREGTYQGGEQIQVFLHYGDSRYLSSLLIGLRRYICDREIRNCLKSVSGRHIKYLGKIERLVWRQLRAWWDRER